VNSRGLVLVALIVWVGAISYVSDSLAVGLTVTGSFLALGLLGKVAISVAEDWIEGREARKRREAESKWEELKKKTNTPS
jgi:hypothetical protein